MYLQTISTVNSCRLKRHALARYNERLDTCFPWQLNETLIEQKLDALERIGASGRLYVLVLARIAELALYCAGAYADNGEFGAVGDLLFNPRLTFIHLKGADRPVPKKRHGALTDHFSVDSHMRTDLIGWVKRNVTLEVKKPPLLAYLHGCLEDSGHISKGYLNGMIERMNRVAEVVGFLAAYRVSGSEALYRRIQWVAPAEQTFIRENLCNFDLDTFFELGDEFRKLAENPSLSNRFLSSRSTRISGADEIRRGPVSQAFPLAGLGGFRN